MVWTKTFLFRTNGPFWGRKWCILRTRGRLKFCRMKRPNRYMKILFCFLRKKIIWGNLIFLGHFLPFDWSWSNWARPRLVGSLNSQDMISFMIATGFLNSQDMISILKPWRHDFWGKYLCDGYCMDIIWCLCVEAKMHGIVKLL